MPIKAESRFHFLICCCKMHLCCFARKDRYAVYRKTLFKHSQFFEPRRKLEGDMIFIVFTSQLDLNLKPHGNVSASTSKILWLHKVIHPIHTSSDFLKDFKRKPDRCLARTILSNQKNGRAFRNL